MNLDIRERLLLLSALPVEGDLVTMRVVSGLRKSLGLTAEEIEKWGVKSPEPGQFRWDVTADTGTEINVAGAKTAQIVKALQRLNDEGRVTEQHLSLFEKFPLE